ncbi:methionine ABC transporter ATP-binding protein [Abyssisolibacter fermentans]|uniref:methionine ABC transporter ATP-binding protein n=1 Tax=Abyssisolibacter fermentans TaxID=1766203 RepID=UPI00082CC6E0|nr:ATP-binding cassette domain-containing protein [Abyssisolibacter fermentans]
MISIENLTKEFSNSSNSTVAVDNINLEINENEIFGIIGLSGAGKSTLIRMLNRLEEPTQGSVIIKDRDITKLNKKELNKIRKKIGMIFQHFNLLKSRTVSKNIAFPLEIAGHNKAEINNRVTELLKLVELGDKANSYPSELSGGQKQRVAIARALANKPDILLCDEATSALDPKTTKSILKLLKNIQNKLGLTVVLITHQMEVIKDVCDRVAIIEAGKIIELDTVKQVFSNPKTETAKAFLSHIKKTEIDDIDIPKIPGSKVIKLNFVGKTSKQPIICKMIRSFDISLNILSGNIHELLSTSLGTLLIQISGNDDEVEKALAWLKSKDIRLDVIWNG